MGGFQIFVWNPSTGQVKKESLHTYLQHLPARMITLRIFSQDHSLDEVLAKAAEETLMRHWPELLPPQGEFALEVSLSIHEHTGHKHGENGPHA